jgi:HAD superfamily hydrolase (TIGR01509 family)
MRPFLRRICRDYGLQRDQASLATLGWLWYEPLAEKATIAPDVRPTLSALTAAGIELGLVINSAHPAGVIDSHLDRLGLLEFFPTRAYSTEIGAHKPDARLFTAALDSIGVSASEAIYVGDEIKQDILGAHRVGMTTVLLRRDVTPQPPAADHLIRDIAQLLDLPLLAHARAQTRPPATIIPALIV